MRDRPAAEREAAVASVRALLGRLHVSVTSVLHSESFVHSTFVWARRVLNNCQKRLFPARAVLREQRVGCTSVISQTDALGGDWCNTTCIIQRRFVSGTCILSKVHDL
jgi:hypothetical protein